MKDNTNTIRINPAPGVTVKAYVVGMDTTSDHIGGWKWIIRADEPKIDVDEMAEWLKREGLK